MATGDTRRGSRVVLIVYLGVVGIAGVMGFVLGSIRPKDLDPELFGIVQLPPTPLGVSLYGMITVAVVLGAFLLAVVIVSARTETETVE